MITAVYYSGPHWPLRATARSLINYRPLGGGQRCIMGYICHVSWWLHTVYLLTQFLYLFCAVKLFVLTDDRWWNCITPGVEKKGRFSIKSNYLLHLLNVTMKICVPNVCEWFFPPRHVIIYNPCQYGEQGTWAISPIYTCTEDYQWGRWYLILIFYTGVSGIIHRLIYMGC